MSYAITVPPFGAPKCSHRAAADTLIQHLFVELKEDRLLDRATATRVLESSRFPVEIAEDVFQVAASMLKVYVKSIDAVAKKEASWVLVAAFEKLKDQIECAIAILNPSTS